MYVHFWILAAAALGIMLGCFYRLSAAVFCLGFTYIFLMEKAYYLNHFYLICLLSFLLIFIPAGDACSVDAHSSTLNSGCVRTYLGALAPPRPTGDRLRLWRDREAQRRLAAGRADADVARR